MILSPSPRILILLLAICFLGGWQLHGQPKAPPAGAQTDLIGPIDIPGDNLDQILALLGRWTGRSLLRPQNLPAVTLSLQMREQVTKEEAIQAVETLLNLNGIAVTPLGDRFLKVTALSAAKSEAPELIEGSALLLPPSGRTVSKLFQLKFLRVTEFMPQIAGLLNPAAGSPPVIFDKANSALITDSVSNLQRIETLVYRLDKPMLSGLEPKFYTLRSAKASDVVSKMKTMMSGPLQTQLGSATSYNADDRTNQIVLIADSRQHGFFDELIARLDVRADPNTRNEVIYLKHASATEVASILSNLVSGQNEATLRTSSSIPATRLTPAASNGSTITAAAAIVPQLGLDPSNQFSEVLTILPEVRSNAIVVSGTVDDLRLIEDLVAKIDVLLAQVRIEVVIAEVTLGDEATSGISELGLQIDGDKLVGFGGAASGIGVTNGVFSRPTPGALDLAATISLVTTPRKSNTNILSVPNIVTTHNKQGTIFVGEQRPVISSYLNDSTNTGGTTGSGYRSTVNQQQIGIELIVTPLIGPDGSVQLEINQTVEDILGEVIIDGNPQPRVGSRRTESFVSVQSGDIIVLGGLQRTSDGKSTSRFGPIPFIGDLFGKRSRSKTRTDLVFFLRPTVLTNTAADNVKAMEQVETFPDFQRAKLKRVLGETESVHGGSN
ncbi:MAG: type II secretory pathway, component PulD [Opitutaceae bacterium]|nr:type II secretory pathway, component PulD [Opitutaceae bacterium]|tara:strand:+ start:255 stop:2252 length:1998 start_codon:yes stop_codon:yes gene_type:complete